MAPWADKYIGIPYGLNERTMQSCDCYGLVYLVYKNEFGIDLPSYSDEYDKKTDSEKLMDVYKKHRDNWNEVVLPKVGDVVYFTIAGFAKHVGVMIDEKHFIHNLRESSTIGCVRSLRWKHRKLGFYRYE